MELKAFPKIISMTWFQYTYYILVHYYCKKKITYVPKDCLTCWRSSLFTHLRRAQTLVNLATSCTSQPIYSPTGLWTRQVTYHMSVILDYLGGRFSKGISGSGTRFHTLFELIHIITKIQIYFLLNLSEIVLKLIFVVTVIIGVFYIGQLPNWPSKSIYFVTRLRIE